MGHMQAAMRNTFSKQIVRFGSNMAIFMQKAIVDQIFHGHKLMAIIVLIFLMESCGFRVSGPSSLTAPVVVYKTKKDYRDHVTVQLSEDGQSIIAFPGPSDVLAQRPLELADGYLLKRMVGNAYLSLSIEAYAADAHVYTEEELLELLMDKDPYLEIYDCSECTGGDTAVINRLIRKQELGRCRSLL